MILRQRLGVLLVLLFLPINGPLLRMLIEKTRMPLPIGEIQFFGLSLFMIVIGTLMIFTPKIKFRSDSIE